MPSLNNLPPRPHLDINLAWCLLQQIQGVQRQQSLTVPLHERDWKAKNALSESPLEGQGGLLSRHTTEGEAV